MRPSTVQSSVVLPSLLAVCGVAAPVSYHVPQDLYKSAYLWAGDVQQVVDFLDQADRISPETFATRALIAASFAKEQLTWKATLDGALRSDPTVHSAGVAFLERAYDAVVGLLDEMADRGSAAAGNVVQVTEALCAEALPAIDAYLTAVSEMYPEAQPLAAARPAGCTTTGLQSTSDREGIVPRWADWIRKSFT